MKGRKAKNELEHKKNGTYRPSRHAVRAEIKPLEGIPAPPADFDDEKAELWYRFCEDIMEVSVLSKPHLNSVRLLCELMADRRRLTVDIEENGFTYVSYVVGTKGETIPGQIKQNPAVTLRTQIDGMILRIYDGFGFSLRSGMTIKSEKPKPQSAILELMKGGVKTKAG